SLGQLAQRGRRVAELNRSRSVDAERVSPLELDDRDRPRSRRRARDVDHDEVTGERALARAKEPEVRPSFEERAGERELVALEGEGAASLPGSGEASHGVPA